MNDRSPYISYAQNREDIILDAFFEKAKHGFYVDVGANHPVHESVTKLFYDRGWRGMNIEPTEWLYRLLSIGRPRDINVQVGVSNKEGSMPFREYPNGDGLSTFSAEMHQKYEKDNWYFAKEFREYEVPVQTLAHIFATYNVKTIDFMKVDVEGYEYEALASNDWDKYRPKVLCVEANHVMHDWHPMMYKAGYTLAFFDGLNEYFVAKEASASIKQFSYPDRVLYHGAHTQWREEKLRQDAEVERALLAYELDNAKATIAGLQQAGAPAATAGSRLRRKLRGVDSRIESALSSRGSRGGKAAPIDTTPLTPSDDIADYATQLQAQIVQTLPVSTPANDFTLKQYRHTKYLARAVTKAAKAAARRAKA